MLSIVYVTELHLLWASESFTSILFFVVFASRVVEEQSSIRKGLPQRAVEEIRTSNAKQSLSCDKLVGHMHTMLPGLLRA